MKKLLVFVFFVITAMLRFSAASGGELALNGIEPVRVGELAIYPITDANVTMEQKLLPKLDTRPEFIGAFSNGPLPAVDQVFLFQKDGKVILIDTGWGEDGKIKGQTLQILKENGVSPDQVTDILMTHLDVDHIGGLVKNGEKTFPNAKVHIARPEYEAWRKGDLPRRSAETIENANRLLDKYQDKIALFDFDDEILPGVMARDASGHTPGHTAFDISDGSAKMTVAGDILHIWQVQLAAPELSSIYDNNETKAAESRKNLLERAAEEKAIFSGMHFPLISPVIKADNGGFVMAAPRTR